MISLSIILSLLSLLCQSFTQSNGARPFGVSLLIVGFDESKTPKLYQTDPAGAYHEWKVCMHFPETVWLKGIYIYTCIYIYGLLYIEGKFSFMHASPP